jgi:hypothetical protein
MTASSASTDSSGHYVLADVGIDPPVCRRGRRQRQRDQRARCAYLRVAGLRSLSAEQSLACDVTGNGTLSALDATLLLQYATGLISTFPVRTACNSDWVFIPNPASAPGQTLVQPQPGPSGARWYRLRDATTSLDEQNFSALVFGDCTGNWQPPQRASALRALRGTVRETATARARWLPGGRLALRVAVDAAEPIYAAQMEIAYDPVALRMVRARLVGGARHAALAVNDSEAGIVRLALANAEAIRADGRPLAVILFESLSAQRAPVPSVSIRVNRD